MRRVLSWFILSLFVMSAARIARAQSQPNELVIHGTVVDCDARADSGRGRHRDVRRPRPVSATTDQRGAFTLTAEGRPVQRCTCTSTASATWTASPDGRGIGRGRHEFVLQVAGVREAVTVSAPGGYQVPAISTATKTPTPLRDVPQSVTVVTSELIKDQLMMSIGDVVRYVPGITVAPGREQPRPGHHPRQQLVGRLLRQRRARRRPVLPRPLQPRSRRGAEGTERDDLRPRRRRRRRQSRDARRPASRRRARSRCRAACYGNKRVHRRPRPAAQRQGRRSG